MMVKEREPELSIYLRQGFVANLPIAASVAAYGSVLGVLAAQKGIGWGTLLLMNLSIFAGSAQFVMVDMWLAPLPIVEIIAAVFVINLRYLLIGASLRPLFEKRSWIHKATRMHLVADENWAVTMATYRRQGTTSAYLLGGGICVLTAWCMGTLGGHRLGAFIQRPELYALDFAFIAVFTALTVSFWQGGRDILPWLAAATLAVIAERWLPGKWYILCGGVGGAVLAALTNGSEKDDANL